MKKTILLFAAITMAAVTFAQDETPTVSTAGIYLRYCTTTLVNKDTLIPSSLLPFWYGDEEISEEGEYPTIFADKRGCDSVVTLNVSTFNALFSVAADCKVIISKGNLQYQAATGTWRFAEHQYDFVGFDNDQISATNEGWIDLFGWGTSGVGAKPYETSTKNASYPSSTIANTDYDWGQYNAISNGGKQAGLWRTLTIEEWRYLVNGRVNASALRGAAKIGKATGVVLLPDNWNNSITFVASNNFSSNVYTEESWKQMEAKGAIFLPCACSRTGLEISNIGQGRYWSATVSSSYSSTGTNAMRMDITNDGSMTDNAYDACTGYSVRLVRTITE